MVIRGLETLIEKFLNIEQVSKMPQTTWATVVKLQGDWQSIALTQVCEFRQLKSLKKSEQALTVCGFTTVRPENNVYKRPP